jgi:putative colanic acid biosynthesis glycosyltransferase
MPKLHVNLGQTKTARPDVTLSIITVVRNDCRRLAVTIRSLERLYGDYRYEHIVIDGNSIDGTQKYLEQNNYHTNFRFFSESDEGIYDAMNKGARLATGHFLLFLNCGDRMLASPDQVDRWLSPFKTEQNADIVCFCVLECDGVRESRLQPDFSWPYRMPTSHQAMIFEAKFIRNQPYDIRYKIAADFSVYLKADRSRVLVSSESSLLVAIEAKGMASEHPLQSYAEYLKVINNELQGVVKWLAVTRVGTKAIVVVLSKWILPASWLAVFRKYK